jgi:hypothetical protein
MSKTKLEDYFWACYAKKRKSLNIFVEECKLAIEDDTGTEVISSFEFDFIDELREEVKTLASEIKQRGYEIAICMKPKDYFINRNKDKKKNLFN